MKAVAHTRPLPISDPASPVDIELPKPSPTGRDLLVKVEAVSVNPVDTKRRMDSANADLNQAGTRRESSGYTSRSSPWFSSPRFCG